MKSCYKEAIDYIYNLNKYGIKLGLNNISGLLSIFDNPHLKTKVIHIAGTNGKGSTAAVLHSILQKANYKVGLYTSPHLVSFQERMKINGEYITQDEVCALLKRLKPAIKKIAHTEGYKHPTFFEVVTAMAFLYFYEKNVDFAIMEVGLGGRLDATNICRPLVSIVTHLGFDHMEQLGNTLSEIAAEKGAIIKQNTAIISGQQLPEAAQVIEKIAQEKEAPLYIYGEQFKAVLENSLLKGNYFNYSGIYYKIINLFVPLAGEYQLENASLAIAAAELLNNNGFKINKESIIEGARHAQWPGRFEIIREKPLVILDGAHNPDGVTQFMKNLKRLIPDKNIIAVLGVFQDKDFTAIVKTIVTQINKVILTMADNPRATPTTVLMEEVSRYMDKKHISETNSVAAAIDKALQIAREDEIIIITGSLYTVGEAKAYFLEKGK
ncbi:MAG: bifunctional folylpolyglutamate synthase/dihydrofolate synthase [Candidatus Atribacteria bacterium]|nr:bifunctional folylpolyglutamate synthase/dihydrofolate synthase [Candidatus Atribacteria bacterium]